MAKLGPVLFFVAMTFLSWGSYGILLNWGKADMEGSALRPFVGVGLAYFLIAVVVPLAVLAVKPEKGNWSFRGSMLSVLAGTVGALGALGVILALVYRGDPIYVMPLIFGGAPVVNTLVTMALSKTQKEVPPIFALGLLLVVAGSVGVLVTRPPHSPKPATAQLDTNSATVVAAKAAQDSIAIGTNQVSALESNSNVPPVALADIGGVSIGGVEEVDPSIFVEPPNIPLIVMSVLMAAVCWGAYGPILHLGQARMGGSRLRPFCCVGLAYFVVAVAIPLGMIFSGQDKGEWAFSGMAWSITAGAAGAIGALGIIMAFNFGGKPIYMMPLVFGFAPIVNTIVTMMLDRTFGEVSALFFLSLLVTVVGAVLVLVFPPKDAAQPQPAISKPAIAS